MRQRVGIARVPANSPRVLLMDEPFGALDALTCQQMQDLVVELWEHSRPTVVFATHDVDEAIRIASSIVVDGLHRRHRRSPATRWCVAFAREPSRRVRRLRHCAVVCTISLHGQQPPSPGEHG